jgi:hypothetical protein
MFLLAHCKKDEPVIIVKIPDNSFLHALIKQGVDKNVDGAWVFRSMLIPWYMLYFSYI